ncbi:MAG: glutaredoxin [Candidatus Brockarchaeota archaeon]|nr:glutaredoxin [Candidatus Brockarchaeota archaeon]
MDRLRAVHVVYARWCPHCVPLTVESMERVAKDLGATYVLHDIDSEADEADELVRKYGDWSDDYLVPQVFLEFESGKFQHVLTGRPEGVEYTRKAISAFLRSELYIALKEQSASGAR